MTPYYDLPLLSLDTETTGINPLEARVVTCNMTYDTPGEEPKIYDWLIDPMEEIPLAASAVHGITTDHARTHGMPAKVGLENIKLHLETWESYGLPIVVYNAAYDLSLLLAEFERHNVDHNLRFDCVIDPLVLDKGIDKYRRGSRKLTDVAAHYGIVLDNAHSADADSMASVLTARAIGQKYKIDFPLDEVHAQQVLWKKEQFKSYREYRRKTEPDWDDPYGPFWPYYTERSLYG